MIREFFRWMFDKRDTEVDQTSWNTGRDFENYVYNHLVMKGYKIISRSPIYNDGNYNDKMDPFRDITFVNPVTKKVYHIECKYKSKAYGDKIYFLKNEAQYWKYKYFAQRHNLAKHCIVLGIGQSPSNPWCMFVFDLNEMPFYNGYYKNTLKKYVVRYKDDLHKAIMAL
jgi:hypothetical protein